jgi:hypothetical protein
LRNSKIKLVITRHEQAAGFMAATYGRLTGRAGVCLTTLGPGALNLTTSAAYADLGAMPMVMITGQKAIHTSRQAKFQIVDVVATMRPLTKLATQIVCGRSPADTEGGARRQGRAPRRRTRRLQREHARAGRGIAQAAQLGTSPVARQRPRTCHMWCRNGRRVCTGPIRMGIITSIGHVGDASAVRASDQFFFAGAVGAGTSPFLAKQSLI